MFQYTASSLKYKYRWPLYKSYRFRIPDDDIIHADNGYDMIDFITTFLTEQGCLNREAIQKLEYLLHQHLPMQLNTRKEIGLWILKNSDKDSEYKI